MAQLVPINGELLVWAMEQSGLSTEDLAEQAEVPADEIQSWIRGKSKPQTGKFRRVAKQLNRPVRFFLQVQLPQDSLPVGFRRFVDDPGAQPLTAAEQKAIQKARRIQQLVGHVREQLLNDGETRYLRSVPDLRDFSAAAAGLRLRGGLGWSVEEQIRATSPSRVFGQLRSAMESLGVIVMVLPLRSDGARGLSIWTEAAPLVVVNSAQTTQARTYTLAHELGHLVNRSGAIDADLNVADDGLERWCDEFAAELLLPEDAIAKYVFDRLGGFVSTLSGARTVSNKFKVSLLATCYRLRELGLGSAHLPGLVPVGNHWKPDEEGFNPDPTAAANRIREYGTPALKDLLDAEARGLLKRHDVQRYLKLNTERYDDLVERVSTSPTLDLQSVGSDR